MLPVLALAVTLAAAPAGGVSVDVEVRAGGVDRAPAVAWSEEADGVRVGRASDPAFDAVVRLSPPRAGARALEVTVTWREAIGVERVAARVRLGGPGVALDRTLRLRPVDRPVRVGRATPVWLQAGDGLLVGGEGVLGARYAPVDGGRAVEAILLADDASDRPFATYPVCTDRLDARAQQGQFGALERKVPHLEAPRRAGAVERLSAVLVDRDLDRPARPAIVERWPWGARAAVVFTDHADRTEPAALRAVLWGSAEESGVPGRGFLGRGVRLTRSFFVRAREGGLDDPAAAAAADELRDAGSEVSLHSITEGRDPTPDVRDGLAAAARWAPSTWIDHQPYTNCEALSSEGGLPAGPYGVRDALAEAGVRWVWAAGDVAGFRAVEVVNLLDVGPGDAASPAVYPFPGDPRIWVLQSSMFFAPPARLGEALSGLALERLEEGRGLFVAHTYLGAGPRVRTPAQRERLAVTQGPGGRLEIAPELDAALARIQARVEAGSLASLTWSEAGDRLRALGDVSVEYLPDGAARLRNAGDWPLPGLTVGVPEEGLDLALDGPVSAIRVDLPGWSRVAFDLPPGAAVVLRAFREDGAAAPLP